jgi:hypothetical protein
MSTDTKTPPQTPVQRAARVFTEVFAPAVWAAAMPLIISVHAAGTVPAGLGWGLLAVVFSSVIPYGVIWWGVRRGELTDHHIGRREQRRKPLIIGLASVLVGLVLLIVLSAPRQLVAMVVVMLVVLLGTTAVNLRWKLSAHAAVSAGSATVLVLVFGPWLLFGAVLVALIGWSRVVLRDHTTAQVIAGTASGVLLAALVWTLLG